VQIDALCADRIERRIRKQDRTEIVQSQRPPDSLRKASMMSATSFGVSATAMRDFTRSGVRLQVIHYVERALIARDDRVDAQLRREASARDSRRASDGPVRDCWWRPQIQEVASRQVEDERPHD
jgi:hypothetical protein